MSDLYVSLLLLKVQIESRWITSACALVLNVKYTYPLIYD